MDPNHSPQISALKDLYLANNQVHVWQAWLDYSTQELTGYYALLSADEKARVKRFHFERDRNHYIVCRGLLRSILSAYLNIKPTQIEFCYGAQGKPALRPGLVEDNIEFNLSHSKGLGVFAFCRGNPIGIDVEYIRPILDADSFAEQFFSAPERHWLGVHEGVEKLAGFFKIWTCKEAFFKANGDGLTLPINRVVIDLDSSQPARLVAINGNQEQAARWKIVMFEPSGVYQAALAVEGQNWQATFGWLSSSTGPQWPPERGLDRTF